MNPGKYRSKITIQKATTVSDEYGEPGCAWADFKTVWAKKFELVGTDFYVAQTGDVKIETKFTCRYFSGLTRDMRIVCGSDVYEIVGVPVDVDQRHTEWLIYCKAV